MYFCFQLAGQSSICYWYLQCRGLSSIQQRSLWMERCLECDPETILLLGWGWKEMKAFGNLFGLWGRKSEITNLSVEDENLRLAMCILTLWESTRSAGWWFELTKSLLPSTRQQVTPGTRCSFSTLREGLISNIGIDTIWFLPYRYMASAWTQTCCQVESMV